jgi:hypothetical protein
MGPAGMGLGTGCMIAPLSTEAVRNVPPHLAGAASGVNKTVPHLVRSWERLLRRP